MSGCENDPRVLAAHEAGRTAGARAALRTAWETVATAVTQQQALDRLTVLVEDLLPGEIQRRVLADAVSRLERMGDL